MVQIVRNIIRWVLLLFSVGMFLFALLSGAEGFGGGAMGIIRNSPNALPWLLLLVLVYIVWKSELVGGLLLLAFGIGAIFFFNLLTQGWLPFAVIGLPPMVLGVLLLLVHFGDKQKKVDTKKPDQMDPAHPNGTL